MSLHVMMRFLFSDGAQALYADELIDANWFAWQSHGARKRRARVRVRRRLARRREGEGASETTRGAEWVRGLS